MEKKMIPPDGGWGWIIAMAYGLNNVIMVPILQGFSLVLKDVFKDLNIPATDATIILSVNSAFGMGVGLLHGPLLRKFGYRKIALVGSMIFTIGITMTAFATTFTHFMITYGLMASLGVGLTMSSFSLAVNTYFVIKRGRAVGMAMTFTGLGPILMPQLISYLLSTYGTQGTIIILGGLTLHSLVGTMLLQPVKWHATWQTVEPQKEQSNSIKETETKDETSLVTDNQEIVTIVSENGPRERKIFTNIDENEAKINYTGGEGSKKLSDQTVHPESRERDLPYKWWSSAVNLVQSYNNQITTDEDQKLYMLQMIAEYRKQFHDSTKIKSVETVNLGSSVMIFDENIGSLVIEENHEDDKNALPEVPNAVSSVEIPLLVDEKLMIKDIKENPEVSEKLINQTSSGVSCWKKVFRSIVRFFDFDLLRDPIYVNMMVGMSIALFAEINFAILTPFILADMTFSTEQIAAVMSTLAAIDLVTRGLVPFIGEWLRLSARHMALVSLFLLICWRTMLIFTRNFVTVIVVAIGLGFAKGIRSVTMSLVIPNYIPIERLASATGIQMVVNGLVLMTLGPLLGLSRDKFGSYVVCLIMINSTTALTIIMWITEMYIVRRKTKRREKKKNHQQVDVRE